MISKRVIFSLFFAAASLLAVFIPAAQASSATGSSNILYYSLTCPHCAKVEAFFDENGVWSKYSIIKKEVSQNPANAKELYDAFAFRNVPPDQMGVPYLIFEGQAFSGDVDIINFFKAKLGISTDSNPGQSVVTPISTPSDGKAHLTIPTVVVAALADSINPCAFSVMVFLLLSLLAIGARKRMLKVGMVYIVTVYIVYLAAGLGLLAVFQAVSIFSKYILYTAAILAIIAGLINIKDFFFYGKGFSLAIPESKKHLMDKYIKHASIPAAIILGFLVALFELPCTGGFYLAILALLAKETTFWNGFAYLAFYNVIFVAPLFIILAVVYKGVKPEKLEEWRVAKRGWMRLVMGLVLVGLGLALIFLF